MTTIRKLTVNDRVLISEALSWIDQMPRWARDADETWGKVTADAYCEMMRNDPQIDLGIFDEGEFIAILTLAQAGEKVWNTHLMMKRSASKDCVIVALASVKKQLLDHGMRVWSWAWARNEGLQEILQIIGMARDGLEQYKGTSHGQPLLWIRYTC